MNKNQYKTKELRETDKMLRNNGFTRLSCRGDHFKYTNGAKTIVITGKCNRMMIQRLIKENNLEV